MAYTPTTWQTGDLITAERLNKLEQGVANEQVGPAGPAGPAGPQGEPGTPGTSYTAATTTQLGVVKQSANVAQAAGENVTAAEFNALLDALTAAGIMAANS